MRVWRRRAAVMGVVWACVAWSAVAQAQSVGEARYGQRFFTLGLSTQPGSVSDPDGAPGERPDERMVTWSNMVLMGLHHYLHPHFSMAVEGGFGLVRMRPHTVTPRGERAGERAVSWQVGLMGRWLVGDDLSGLTVGGGMHLFTAALEDATAQQLAGELRLGWVFWSGRESPRFAVVELGMGAPIVQGLRLPDNVLVVDGDDVEPAAASNWSWWRSTMTLQVSF